MRQHLSGEQSEEQKEIEFFGYCTMSFWASVRDMSLSPLWTFASSQTMQSTEVRRGTESYIIVNELYAAYEILRNARREGKEETRVDIALNNAVFELSCDFLLDSSLLDLELATHVVVHYPKSPPVVADANLTNLSTIHSMFTRPKDFWQVDEEGKPPPPLLTPDEQNTFGLSANCARNLG